MVQVQEKCGLGPGQEIETEMAEQAKIKIFRTVTTCDWLDAMDVPRLEKKVEEWYATGCLDMSVKEVLVGWRRC